MTDPKGENNSSQERIICQLARMGDLVQMRPLIAALSRDSSLTLICDRAVEDWAAQLPGIDQVLPLDTRRWRRACSQGNFSLPQILSDLRSDLDRLSSRSKARLYALNDHPVGDALAAWICHDDQSLWLNWRLVLLRSYLRTIAADRRWNRIHLSDLWQSLADSNGSPQIEPIPVTPVAKSFAPSALKPFRQSGLRCLWAFILGSGGKSRRIEPEDFAGYWNNIPERERIGLMLIGGKGEEELGYRFLRAAGSSSASVLNLVGSCQPQELLSIFSAADLVIGVDTGPLHWAAAAGAKVLGLYFGEAGIHDTGPYGEGHFVLVPDCPDYPCSPEFAVRCGYRCRQSFENHQGMAGLLASMGQNGPRETIPVPAGLRLYQSRLSPAGIDYRPANRRDASPEIVRFGAFVRRVFMANRTISPADDSIYGGFGQEAEGLYRRWLAQIDELSFSGLAAEPILKKTRLEAREHLRTQTAFFKSSH